MLRRILLAACILAAGVAPVRAYDLSLSVEGDATPGCRYGTVCARPDIQAQVGQSFGDYRLFVSGEWTQPSDSYPNSPRNYRLGLQRKLPYGLVTESGVGNYVGQTYLYIKATWSYDSAGGAQ